MQQFRLPAAGFAGLTYTVGMLKHSPFAPELLADFSTV
jgi:hypothetical protein